MSDRRIDYLETLGKGGFGAVYLAEVHGRDDFVQRLAVKVLSAEMNLTADMAARQRDEARLLARLNHDHIVRVVDLTEVDGRPAVLMEYVEGADASQLLRAAPIPPRAAVQIAQASASALNAAWSTTGRNGQALRVIHRDIKPANLLVSRHGGVKVLDFGVARADFDREGVTGSVQFGTARYMAPEQWLLGESSHKVDIYALGVTLVELLTGLSMERAPLAPDAFQAHMDATRAMVIRPDWPAGFAQGVDTLLEGMLSFTPGDRPDAARCYEALSDLADAAPGDPLRRWAPQAVPPCIEARRRRWAAESNPAPEPDPAPPARVPVELTATAMPSPEAAPSATRLLPTEARPDADPVDTLATTRPTAPGARGGLVRALAASFTLCLVLAGAGGAWTVWPAAEPPPTEPPALTDPVEVASPPAGSGPTPAEVPEPSPPAGWLPAPPEAAGPAPQPSPRTPPAEAPIAAPGAAVSEPLPAAPLTEPEPAREAAAVASPTAPADPPPGEASPAAEETPSTGTTAATVAISISSSPWGAEVQVDGRRVGTTPLRGLVLPVGAHQLHLRLGEAESSHAITIGGRNPAQYTWTLETNQWRSSY